MAKFLVIACLLAVIGVSTSVPVIPNFGSYVPWRLGHCETNGYTYMKNFKPAEFFNATWYEFMSFGTYMFQMEGKCPAFESAVDINENDVNFLFYQYVPLLNKWVNLRGRSHVNEMSGSKFSIQFDFAAGLANVQIPYSIIDTDYENYAVFYSCQEAFGFKLEMAWASTRVPGDKTHQPNMKEAIENAGLRYEEFNYNDQSECDKNPPSL